MFHFNTIVKLKNHKLLHSKLVTVCVFTPIFTHSDIRPFWSLKSSIIIISFLLKEFFLTIFEE